MRSGRCQSLHLSTRKLMTQTSHYRGILLLSTAYRILTNILLSRLTPYAEEIIGDHKC